MIVTLCACVSFCLTPFPLHLCTLPPSSGLCHIFSHLGHHHKCHSWELLAASVGASSSTQNLRPLKARGKNSVWLQIVFPLNWFYWLHLDFWETCKHEWWARLVRLKFFLPHALICFEFLPNAEIVTCNNCPTAWTESGETHEKPQTRVDCYC